MRGATTTIDDALARVPGLRPDRAADLRALFSCLAGHCPDATIVLGGSLASPRHGVADRGVGDVDLFLILPSWWRALAVLRSTGLRRALSALPLGIEVEIVVLWEALVRRGRTSVGGTVLSGDLALASAIGKSPAPPSANLLASAHHYLVQSLLDSVEAERLLAKAALTGFRAWVQRHGVRDGAARSESTAAMIDLFALDATERQLARAEGRLDPAFASLVGEALARQRGRAPAWDEARVRPVVHRFLCELGAPATARRFRRLARHASARRRFGVSPFQLIDADGCFVAAARSLVAATLAAPATGQVGGGAAPASDPLDEAEASLRRLIGLRSAGTRAERIRRAALALDAYGRHYPHKILLPALPPVPSPNPDRPGGALISVVVPCRNGAAMLPALLEGVRQQHVPAGYAVETIVVDNESGDDSAAVARAHGAIVEREPRPGASAARNRGIRRAGGDTIVFLDADARPIGRDFFHHVLRALALSPAIGLVGAAIECDEHAGAVGRADHMVSFFNWQATQLAEPRHFHPSAALAARRAVCDATGGFAPEILRFHDFDFCRRARELGFQLYFEPRARAAHVPRSTLRAALGHSYAWGTNTRRVYAPYDPVHQWWFLDRPLLFALNVPVHIANRIWLTVKRWIWRRPLDTIVLLPVMALLLVAWGAGVARGGWQWIHAERGAPATTLGAEGERADDTLRRARSGNQSRDERPAG